MRRASFIVFRASSIRQTALVYATAGLLMVSLRAVLHALHTWTLDMAWEHIHLVREIPLQYIEKLILFALASRVDAEGTCWPSIDTICHDTGLKHRTTQIHLKALVEGGYVSRLERPGRSALLRLNMRVLATGASDADVQNVHPGVHAVLGPDAARAPEVTIEQPINRQMRKLSTPRIATANSTASTTWWASAAGIEARGRELQVLPRPGEGYAEYKDRLLAVERHRRTPP
jgi:DNA-binding transcriptional ArsR family regulator